MTKSFTIAVIWLLSRQPNKRDSNFDCSNDVVRKRFLAPSLVLLERVTTGIVVSFKGLIQVF